MNIDVLRQNIRQLRIQKGWTQARLADEINVSPDTVQKWETLYNTPGIDDVAKLDYTRSSFELEK